MNKQASKTKRIAIVTPYGAEARYDNYAEFVLAHTLRERDGIDVRMYTYAMRSNPAYQDDSEYMGVPTYRCRQRYGFSPRLIFSILRSRPDVVICFHPKSMLNLSAYVAARLVGAKFIVEIVGILHDPYIVADTDEPEGKLRTSIRLVTSIPMFFKEFMSGRLNGLWTNLVCHMPTAHADTIIAINDDEQNWIRKIYDRESIRIYWCTPKFINSRETAPKAVLPTEFLFFIGQIKRRKGWDTAIEALSLLKKRGVSKNLVFVTPQRDVSEPAAYAAQLGVTEQITFLCSVSNEEKNWLYTHAQYVLIPSRYEGFGLPVFESFLAAKPICATDITVFREFLKNEDNAMLFTAGDANALAHAIEKLDSDPVLRNTLVLGGKATAEKFNYRSMVESYEKLF